MNEKTPSSLTTPAGSSTRTKASGRQRKSRLELHQAHCGICSHDLRDEIDEAFVSWECVSQIAQDYRVPRSALYRHAQATGLFEQRNRNIRNALGHIIQHAGRVEVTVGSIIRAVKLFAHIDAHGSWVQPPTRVIYSSAPDPAAPPELSGTPSQLFGLPTP
jgi:hypothetical protein